MIQITSNEFAALSPLKQSARFQEMAAAASPRREPTADITSTSGKALPWSQVMAEVQGRTEAVSAKPGRFGQALPWKDIMAAIERGSR